MATTRRPRQEMKGDDTTPKNGVDNQKKHKRSKDDEKTAREKTENNAKSSQTQGLEIVPYGGTPDKKKRKTEISGVSTTASSEQDTSHEKRVHNGAATGCSPEKKRLKFDEDSSADECDREDEACLCEWFHL